MKVAWTPEQEKVFADRGIDASVRDERHRPYATWEDVIKWDPKYETLMTGQIRWLKRMIAQSHGIVMLRHAPPLGGVSETLEPIFAELRPIKSVETKRRRHNFVDKNGEFWDHHTATHGSLTKAWEKHIARAELSDDHHGMNDPNDHIHVDRAKYLFPPGPSKTVVWTKDGVAHERQAKDRSASRAKRLDVHPQALSLFSEADTIYFALEGCLKADAILTAILRFGERASVFSVPSVTLWDCYQKGELAAFAEQYLRDKRVIIVPDSDWDDPGKDGAVLAQALYCRRELQDWGVEAHIAAPTPEPKDCTRHNAVAGKKRGIDDYLADGERLADLRVIDRRTPLHLDEWERGGGSRQYASGKARTMRLLEFLSLHASEDAGEFHAPLLTIARRSHIDRKQVREDLQRLMDVGAIESDKPLRTRDRKWIPWPSHNPYREGGFYRDEEAWGGTPTFTVSKLIRASTDLTMTVSDIGRPNLPT